MDKRTIEAIRHSISTMWWGGGVDEDPISLLERLFEKIVEELEVKDD